MNKITAKTLLNSKWTARQPKNSEKHFVVTKVKFDDCGVVTLCMLEAVINKHSEAIDWKALKNSTEWIQGWK